MNAVLQRFAERMIEVCRTVHRVVLSGFDCTGPHVEISCFAACGPRDEQWMNLPCSIYEINPEGRLEI